MQPAHPPATSSPIRTARVPRVFAAAAVVVWIGASCEGDDPEDEAPDETREEAGDPETDEPAELEGTEMELEGGPGEERGDSPFEAYDLDALAAEFEGAWVVGGRSLGAREAWEVEGDEVRIYDGEEESRYAFEIVSPCQVALSDEEAGSTRYANFAYDGEALYSGLGAAGARAGDDIVACISAETYVLSGDDCTAWRERFGGWEQEEGDCALDGDTFEAGDRALSASGDAFLSEQMENNRAEGFEAFENAKDAIDAE